MKYLLRVFLVVGLMFVAVSVGARDATAGLCGGSCISCEGAPSPDYKTGDGSGGHQRYKLFCTQPTCSACNIADELARTSAEAPGSIAARLRAADSEGLERMVRENRSNLRLDASRGMAVILGGCDGKSVASVVVLNSEQLDALRTIGVQSLASHFAELQSGFESEVEIAN